MRQAEQRSQPILRLPRDQTPAVLTMGGERAHVMLFVPPGGSIADVLDGSEAFLPVSFSSGTRLVARAAIACVTVRELLQPEPDLPIECQAAIVRLRGGIAVEGELRWVAPPGRRRTLDHLNDGSPYLIVHRSDETSYVAKAHVIDVEEA